MNSVKPGERAERLEDEFVWWKESGVAIPSYAAPVYMIMFLKKEAFTEKMIYTVGTPLEIRKS